MTYNLPSMALSSQVMSGNCPDSQCGKLLFFPSYLQTAIECTNCGQHHLQCHILNVKPVSDAALAIRSLLHTIAEKVLPSKRVNNESVMVNGMSNYTCKLISHLLTTYGYDKDSCEAVRLKDMNKGEIFDCSLMSDRAFMIDEKDLLVSGFGRDQSGSCEYLLDTLNEVARQNEMVEAMVPLHADGDGHCLLHAISRALVGRELFWHPLMINLKAHLSSEHERYKMQFHDFIEDSEWNDIINEADPEYVPSGGETHGLRNIHVFGLANVLRRPIILLDALDGMRSKGDYSGTFLPAFVDETLCRGKDGTLNKPIVIAWSSKGRNHFVPVVGVKERGVPKFPVDLLPKPWGIPVVYLARYIEITDGYCSIGGMKTLSDKYLQDVVVSMEKKFLNLYNVLPKLVADVHEHVVKQYGVVGLSFKYVIEATRLMIHEERLFCCLDCSAINEEKGPVPVEWLQPGGELYRIAVQAHGNLKDNYLYKFPKHENVTCRYNRAKDRLLLVLDVNALRCKRCQRGNLRLVTGAGSIVYQNGDKTSTVSTSGLCGCGYKHYWDGKEYDSLPLKLPVVLEWNNKMERDFVYWFQDESDATLNSNAFELAVQVVQKHFPGEFGSERLVQKVVDQIFALVLKEPVQRGEPAMTSGNGVADQAEDTLYPIPSKIILTGAHSKTTHKEELTASKAELLVQKKIEIGAAQNQRRLSASQQRQLGKSVALGPEKKKPNAVSDEPKSSKGMTSLRLESANKHALEKKLKIAAGDRGTDTFSFTDLTVVSELQTYIEDRFAIKPNDQIIRTGFPPRLFIVPSSDESQVLPFSHGDKITVSSAAHATRDSSGILVQATETSSLTSPAPSSDATIAQPNVVGSGSAVSTLTHEKALFDMMANVDFWPLAETQRYMFKPGGLFYLQTFKDLEQVSDGQHFLLPGFQRKVFTYSKKDDEILLCLGKFHVPVQKLSAETLALANKQRDHIVSHPTTERENSRSVLVRSLHESDPRGANGAWVFSGEGRTLSERGTLAVFPNDFIVGPGQSVATDEPLSVRVTPQAVSQESKEEAMSVVDFVGSAVATPVSDGENPAAGNKSIYQIARQGREQLATNNINVVCCTTKGLLPYEKQISVQSSLVPTAPSNAPLLPGDWKLGEVRLESSFLGQNIDHFEVNSTTTATSESVLKDDVTMADEVTSTDGASTGDGATVRSGLQLDNPDAIFERDKDIALLRLPERLNPTHTGVSNGTAGSLSVDESRVGVSTTSLNEQKNRMEECSSSDIEMSSYM